MHAIGTQNEVKYMKKIMCSFGVCQSLSQLIALPSSTQRRICGKAAWR